MKIKNITYMAGIFTAAFTLSACEDALEVSPPVNQISSAQVFESVSTADAALSNLYAEFQAYSLLSGGAGGAGALLGTYTDELYSYGINTQNAEYDLYNNTQIATNTRIKSVWTNAYKEIYMANVIINGVKVSAGITEDDQRRIHGEALFLRSLVYYYLTSIFGDIPYTVSTDYSVNQSLAKTEEAEVLMKIENDLQQAALMLNDSYRNNERIYANRKTAELILATVMMKRSKWQEAEALLRGIVQNPVYVWQPDLTKTFKTTGKHILWQLKPLKANDATPEALLFYFITAVPNTYTLSDNLFASFTSNDLRRQAWIKPLLINQKTYYRADKYQKTVNNTDEYSIVVRLEEAYLLLAENLAQQNKISEALPFLNAVKQKAGLAPLPDTLTKQELVTEIIDESCKEFFTEKGMRFLTLKRNGRLNSLIPYKTNWQPFHQNWPLPASELLVNPRLKPQNDGY
ncbi:MULTISPECIES: RagB/SusD family nutrient uptake outer membrane protein [unclassified Kaistella]|uniref:RagB/SusD family nutrient uptake outer membrane protein n=1 Tax=unclassified Kaistella TaxID=2762626 RepID=UPI0027358299|nr:MULTISPECIES: RagB/SusD family nutrient uptake outer membrane protein [unclassified Kaistella]MDP2452500.1 RagB/SusD family nutrient uptake outer membrane protein [Kaistella sp. SH11-4b]MDP2455408.1 RagB/SusD family nutrient uptake outer membrane protein [Kaistella sp. SH40-3]MDP2458312.1 RagB/SusD family nutrient uptake outer membrane protein [Kaistella sp. SH19-2b]